MNLSGVFPPLTTPFASDGSVALADLRANVARYNRAPLAGYVVLGSTGEAVLLSRAEMDAVLGGVREAAAPEKILIAGTGAESTSETIERTRRAADLGYRVALVKTPHYYKPQLKPSVLIEHFRRVADASPIPVLLYSVPQFTGVALEAPEVAELASHRNIIGIKESSGHVQRTQEIIASTPPEFQTLVGSASTFYPSLAVGARGGILALACVLPELCVELHRAARDGNHDHARELQQRLLPASKAIVAAGGIAGIKYAMDLVGYRGGFPRPPLLPLSSGLKATIDGLPLLSSTGVA
jgi:4-hydroxy-2-oxoglutarate aldolase